MIHSKFDYIYYLEQDRISNSIPSRSLKNIIKSIFFPSYEWRFIKSLRRLEYCDNVLKNKFFGGGILLWLIAKYRFRKISVRLGYSIPINVFGPGLSLPHRGNIIINPKTKIGSNCRIHVGVNIGAHKDLAPVIGDNVYIGPGAILFGDIKIGNNVTIGANATVNKSFDQDNITIAGTPARIVKENTYPWNHR